MRSFLFPPKSHIPMACLRGEIVCVYDLPLLGVGVQILDLKWRFLRVTPHPVDATPSSYAHDSCPHVSLLIMVDVRTQVKTRNLYTDFSSQKARSHYLEKCAQFYCFLFNKVLDKSLISLMKDLFNNRWPSRGWCLDPGKKSNVDLSVLSSHFPLLSSLPFSS